MSKLQPSRLSAVLIFLSFIFIFGCSGGGGVVPEEVKIVVGSIAGPLILAEESTAGYKIDVTGASSVIYNWAVEPASVGTFQKQTSSTPLLTINNVSTLTVAKITVTVTADDNPAEIRSLNIEIRDMGSLSAGNISGPDEINEDGFAFYSIEAEGEIVLGYQWSCDPPDSGIFTSPKNNSTYFRPGNIGSDTDINISVAVNAGTVGPVIKTVPVSLKDVIVLEASEITGPNSIDENSECGYRITASGDSGIKIEWSFEPAGIGHFSEPNSPVTVFTVDSTNQNIAGKITATVSSDNYPTIKREQNLTIHSVLSYDWGLTWGNDFDNHPGGIDLDQAGNLYVTGTISGPTDMDPGEGVQLRGGNSDDAYLSKFSKSGELVWSLSWGGGNGYAQSTSLDIDKFGNIYVAGWFLYEVDFDPGPGTELRVAGSGYPEAFVTKFDQAGNWEWVATWGGYYYDYATGVEIDDDGLIYIIGEFYYEADFDPGEGVVNRIAYGYNDNYLLKLGPSGEFRWVRTWGCEYDDVSANLAVDSQGNVFMTGGFYYELKIQGYSGTLTEPWGTIDCYLATYDRYGNFRWAASWGGPGNNISYDVDTDNSDSVFVTGTCDGEIDFDPGPGEDIRSAGNISAFISAFDSSGNYKWADFWLGESLVYGNRITCAANGNVVLTGRTYGVVDFDPSPDRQYLLGEAKRYSDFISIFRPSGDYSGTRSFVCNTNPSLVYPASAVDGKAFYMFGCFAGTMDFNPGTGPTNVDLRTSLDSRDYYLIRMLDD